MATGNSIETKQLTQQLEYAYESSLRVRSLIELLRHAPLSDIDVGHVDYIFDIIAETASKTSNAHDELQTHYRIRAAS